ncbi:MAG TPA: universal stress protein [Steroidobacteraceae bacterium]|nr:universal stress protein [Steroidobacteraceae bacterium]
MLAMRTSIDRSDAMAASLRADASKSKRRLKVLCATNALSRSDAAVSRARTIARELGAEMHLVHVVDSTDAVHKRAARRRSALAGLILDAHARELGQLGDRAHISIRAGRPHEAIADVALEWDADLIVLGPYRRRFGDAVIGTTAERVAEKTGRAVLIVNRKAASAYEHVLLTSDLSHVSVGSARLAKQLGLLQRSRASVVHAIDRTRGAMLYRAGVSASEARTFERSLGQLAWNEIDTQLFHAGLDSAHFSIFSPQVSPIRAIEEVTERVGADLVIVGSGRFPFLKRVFLGSVSNEVLRRVKRDVLLVPAAAGQRARRRRSQVDMQPQAAAPVAHQLH